MKTFTLWLQRVKKAYGIRSFEQKMVGVSALVLIVSCFLPWYYGPSSEIISSRLGSNYQNFMGFESYAYIIGYLVFVASGVSLYYFMADLSSWKTPNLKFDPKSVHFYLGERILLMELIALFIYTKQSFDFGQAEVRFGIYLGLVASILHTVFAYMYQRNEQDLPEISAHWNTEPADEAYESDDEAYQRQLHQVLTNELDIDSEGYYLEPQEKAEQRPIAHPGAQDALAKAKQEVMNQRSQ